MEDLTLEVSSKEEEDLGEEVSFFYVFISLNLLPKLSPIISAIIFLHFMYNFLPKRSLKIVLTNLLKVLTSSKKTESPVLPPIINIPETPFSPSSTIHATPPTINVDSTTPPTIIVDSTTSQTPSEGEGI